MFRALAMPGLLLLVWAVALNAQTTEDAGESAAPQLRSEMLVTTEWLSEHIHDPDVAVLCITSRPDFCSRGHIPGARMVELSDISVTRNGVPNELPSVQALEKVFEGAGVSDGVRIVLYGERSGLLAARAYWTLDYLGLGGQAALLDGGLEKWKAEGRPLSQEVKPVQHGTLRVFPDPTVLMSLQDVQNLAKDPAKQATLMDARPADEFSGKKLSEEVAKAGHIPGARHLYWMQNIESAANPVLRSEPELRQMYVELGASPGLPVVTYCRTGVQSSLDYFVAKYLGYKAAMYDGSFYEWSRQNLPVESDVKK
ncbi:MAG: sulfurtransferase [Candidatus Angelobacter sp.]